MFFADNLTAAVEANRKILTPLWYEQLEEGRLDGPIKTDYTKELSELLPLINFWLMSSVFPATADMIQHKVCFIMEVLEKRGLPLLDDETAAFMQTILADITKLEILF